MFEKVVLTEGKSVHFGMDPVFVSRWADRVVAYLLDQVNPDHSLKSLDWSVGEPRRGSA